MYAHYCFSGGSCGHMCAHYCFLEEAADTCASTPQSRRDTRGHTRAHTLFLAMRGCGHKRTQADTHAPTPCFWPCAVADTSGHQRTQADTHASTCLCWHKHAITHAPTWFWDRKCADTYVSTRVLAPHHVCGHTAARMPALKKRASPRFRVPRVFGFGV